MTEDEFFDDHVPHRVNLLTTFRDRYSGRGPVGRFTAQRSCFPWGEPRDFFRCSKDISILMVRFFFDEMGLHLPEMVKKQGVSQKAVEPKERIERRGKLWSPSFNITRVALLAAQLDPNYPALVVVLKAANRAVAHIDEVDVQHPFKIQADHEPLFDVIDWTESLVETHMYNPHDDKAGVKRSLAVAMQLPNNRV